MRSDRAGSAWYVGMGFFFAPALAVVSPWPVVSAMLWTFIGLTGLWLGLLGVAMATGLTLVMRSDSEIPDDYWYSLINARPPSDIGGETGRATEHHAARALTG